MTWLKNQQYKKVLWLIEHTYQDRTQNFSNHGQYTGRIKFCLLRLELLENLLAENSKFVGKVRNRTDNQENKLRKATLTFPVTLFILKMYFHDIHCELKGNSWSGLGSELK